LTLRIARSSVRRIVLAPAIAAGLTIGAALPTSALGLTQVTLMCDDGTTSTVVLDAETERGLVAAVEGMVSYPAGLNCTLLR
jgi:hypothetical protein